MKKQWKQYVVLTLIFSLLMGNLFVSGKITSIVKAAATTETATPSAITTSVNTVSSTSNPSLYMKNVTNNTLSLDKGKSFTLKPSVKASKCKFTSSKKAIATVSSKGKIKAKKVGSTTITVSLKSDKKVKTKVKITVQNKIDSSTTESTKEITEVATWNDELQQKMYARAIVWCDRACNCTDNTSQRYTLSKEHLAFLQDLGNQWSEGKVSKKTMWNKMTTTRFKMWESETEKRWYLDKENDYKVQTIQFKKEPTVNEVMNILVKKQYVYAWQFFYFRYNNKTKTAYIINAKMGNGYF